MSARPRSSVSRRLPGAALALVVTVAAGLPAGGAAPIVPRGSPARAAPAAGQPAARVKTPEVGTARAARAAAAPESAAATRGSTPSRKAGATPLAGSVSAPRTPPTGGLAVAQSPAPLDQRVTYHYNALGRRDPFQSLLGGEYVGADVGGQAPPDVGGIKVVGIVWGDADRFALVEDGRGDSHILRRGDKVMNGYVKALRRDAIIVNLTLDGQAQSVRIPLTRKGEKSNATR